MKFRFFVEHPYPAMVLAMTISLCGVIAMLALPVAQYPDVTPPQVTVTANYPGADARTVLNSVVEPLESEINGVEDLLYLSSSAADSGSVVITATFRLGTDGNTDNQNVQDRVERALAKLPDTVQREGILVQQQQGSILLAIALHSPDGRFDSGYLANYASLRLQKSLARIPGVASVQLFGGSDYAMRLWLDPDALAARGLSADTVIQAVKAQNVQVSAGAVGAAPAPPGQLYNWTLRGRGRLSTPEEFREIIVKSTPDSGEVRLGDIARVEMGIQSYSNSATLAGRPAALLLIYQSSGSNGIEIARACRKLIDEAAPEFPAGLRCAVEYDSTEFIQASVADVAQTIVLAAVLVALVTLLFLQDWRMALVPTLAIPVSVLGTFAGLYLLGYSINLITLFALLLAIGIVVDDAIIVIENIHRLINEEKLSPRDAAIKSMGQITGAVTATTAVLLAMFVPITFLGGVTGELYRQFGVTISIAVLLSAVNALTLSPALGGLLLKADSKPLNFFLFRWFNRFFGMISGRYSGTLTSVLRRSGFSLLCYLVAAGSGLWLIHRLPDGFLPEEDQGVVFAGIRLPAGSSLERTAAGTRELSAVLETLPGVRSVIAAPGFNLINSTSSPNNAFLVMVLEPWKERLARQLSAERIQREAQMRSFGCPELFAMFFAPPPLPGIGAAGGFDLVLRNTQSSEVAPLSSALDRMLSETMQNPDFKGVFTTFNANCPYLALEVDRAKALKLGVSLETLHDTLSGLLGSSYLNDFNRFNQVYQVQIQADADARNRAASIGALQIPNRQGEMVRLDSLVTTSRRTAPEVLSRYNLQLSAELQGYPADGVSSGEAMAELEELCARLLPPGIESSWTAMSYQEAENGSPLPVFLLALLFIYLFLAALYESWLLPFAVIGAVLPALLGAGLMLDHLAIADNLYTRIGILLLFAMACKSAILIVDFAIQRHAAGKNAKEAAEEAARLRFRALVMTAAAFILGTLPLVFAAGPGAGGQRSIGATVTGGMAAALLFGIYSVPLFYRLLQQLLDRKSGEKNASSGGEERH